MADPELETTNKLLRVITALMLRGPSDKPLSFRQQIEYLDEHGVGATEIGKILGRTSTYVSKELAGIRKGAKKKGR
jgi:hypothetical protein